MTISYSLDVSKARFCGFTKLLGRWKGSIYKILWREFLIFCLAYAILSLIYRNCLDPEQKIIFEKIVVFVDTFTDLIPLSFVLGFYVSLVVGRWWGQYQTIPWPDRLCFLIASYVHGSDERSRKIRRTLGRYAILAQALTFQAVSTSVKRRFPTPQHLVAAGIMTKEELSVYDKISFVYGKWWLPCHWFSALATRSRKEGRIKDSVLLNGLLRELLDYRNSCAIMFGYDWISVPLVYTQVVTIATYMYCIALIIGRQYLDPSKGYPKNDIDLYIPFFTLLQFFFYVGWLKVAEMILNPYGEDDDDFELNWCLDRTVHLVYLVVDSHQLKHPKVSKDFFWDEMEPILPQTRHSAKFFVHPQLGSAFDLEVEEAEYIPMDELFEQDVEENVYNGSVKRGNEYRPSLIRRLISSGFGQSRRRRTYRRENSSGSSGAQGISNPAFESNNEKNVVSNRKVPLGTPTSSLNNTIATTPSHGRTSSASFRPNSLTLQKCQTYDLHEAERKTQRLHAVNSAPERSTDVRATPVIKSFSSPPVNTVEKSELSTEELFSEDDCLEEDSNQTETDTILMPPIPEETSKASSVAGVEGENITTNENPLKRLEDVQHLMNEANKVLKELKFSTTSEQRQESNHHESCCSAKEESSDENDDLKDIKSENIKSGDTTIIEIDVNKVQGPNVSSKE
ncbi:bestrophin-3 [Nephila pilipes]|uniref:Bestrophin homolog n=1 Tax=Nephila pilipes TaxID=299642 RepID=A0A8X6PMJ2_NEPPI|nr:bestrophin-3 [Nephila pilipes]